MIIKFFLIFIATFMTCMFWYGAMLAAASAMFAPIRVKKDERRAPRED